MRKWEWSWSILERAKFYAEWNNYFCAVHSGHFLRVIQELKMGGTKNMEYLFKNIIEHPWFIILTDLHFDMM